MSIDEGMIPFSGRRAPCIKVLPNKPMSTGFKVYMIVDHQTKFMQNFYLDDNSLNAKNCENLVGRMKGQIVLRFLANIKQKHLHFFCDRWYTNIELVEELKRRQFHFTGTWKYSPAQFRLRSKKPTNATPRGSTRGFFTNFQIQAWGYMDNGAVYMLDTRYGGKMATIYRRLNSDKVAFPAPKCLQMYNEKMGGVDTYDKLRVNQRRYYSIEMIHPSRKYTHKIFYALMDMITANCFCVHRSISGNQQLTHSQFILEVSEHFLNVQSWINGKGSKRSNLENIISLHKIILSPIDLKEKRCKGHTRRICVYCAEQKVKTDKRTTFMCEICNIYMHPECFTPYHNRFFDDSNDDQVALFI